MFMEKVLVIIAVLNFSDNSSKNYLFAFIFSDCLATVPLRKVQLLDKFLVAKMVLMTVYVKTLHIRVSECRFYAVLKITIWSVCCFCRRLCAANV